MVLEVAKNLPLLARLWTLAACNKLKNMCLGAVRALLANGDPGPHEK